MTISISRLALQFLLIAAFLLAGVSVYQTVYADHPGGPTGGPPTGGGASFSSNSWSTCVNGAYAVSTINNNNLSSTVTSFNSQGEITSVSSFGSNSSGDDSGRGGISDSARNNAASGNGGLY